VESPEALQRQYRALCLEFAAGIAPKMAELEDGLQRLRAAGDSETARAALKDVEAAAHRLAGGGSTFGYPEISRAAVPIDSGARKLGKSASPSSAAAVELLPLIEALRAATANPGEPQI
jgi:hypothetical protein